MMSSGSVWHIRYVSAFPAFTFGLGKGHVTRHVCFSSFTEQLDFEISLARELNITSVFLPEVLLERGLRSLA
ncbi:hypothetical protein BaRGS_00011224 [Batillaria attramentaria]|uniref:Uncharacterized protein n=1 Tax=Batillaria attramentaria TaxID=370345 RepID=A0ABD0LDN4_9CAEN